jgi:hypothetical protein
MRCVITMAMVVAAVAVGGCGLGTLMSEATPYEKAIPAEFNIARDTQGTVAVLVQGGPGNDLRRQFTDAILLELEKKAGVKKARLVASAEVDNLRKDEDKFLAMTTAQVGAAVGAEAVLVVKIVNYGLYPLPMGGYHDCTMVASATLVDVRSRTILWPQNGMGSEVSLALEAEYGDAKVVTARSVSLGAHGVVRHLYDCPKAYFRIPGEKRGNEWDNY